jgi:tripartite-type tricarboxylate transporter receptor subunit TctC
MAYLGKGLLALAALATAGAGAARADAIADFYTKKNISFIVASGAGGGYDTYGRVLMRSYNRHVPGNPNVVVKNMPGASGLRASAYLYNSAARDGTEMGIVYNTNLLEQLFGNKAAHYDPRKMSWIGSMGKLQNICVTWHTNRVKTFEQLQREKAFTVAATGATGNSAQMPRIFNTLLGTDIKVIVGYSTSGQRLALERGEVEGICGLGYSTLAASNPEWIENKRINILIQVGLYKSPSMPNVPMALDHIKDEKNRKVMELLLIRQEWGRPIGGPSGIPADRLAALRTAFDATLKDPKFLDEAKKTKLELEPLTGQQMEELLAKTYAYPPDIIEAASQLVQGKAQFDACAKFAKDSKQCAKKKKKKKKQ